MTGMTGFGHGEHRDERVHLVLEMRSYNNRFLELTVQMPGYLGSLDRSDDALLARGKVRKRRAGGHGAYLRFIPIYRIPLPMPRCTICERARGIPQKKPGGPKAARFRSLPSREPRAGSGSCQGHHNMPRPAAIR